MSIVLDPYFSKHLHPVSICLIGCGGTGSLVLTRLARVDFALKELGFPGLYVNVFDFDKIEYNNVGRQNFLPNEVGDYKSISMISKINFAFGLNWTGYKRKPKAADLSSNFIITCVDNVKTRKEVRNYIAIKNQSYDFDKNFYWIDCGNGKDFGQVLLSGTAEIKKEFNLQDVFDIYGDISKFDNEESQGITGCSYADSLEKQDLFINDSVALECAQMVYTFIKNYYLEYKGVVINKNSKVMFKSGN